MKKLIIVTLLMSVATGTFAQLNPHAEKHDFNSFAQSLNNAASGAAKSTAANWRIASVSSYDRNGLQLEISDSARYKYSNGRGSSMDMDTWEMEDYGLLGTVHYDTAYKYYDMGSGFGLATININEFDNNSRIIHAISQYDMGNGFENSHSSFGKRDANGKISKEYEMYWDDVNMAWDTNSIMVHTYNTQGLVMMDSAYYVGGGSINKTTYEYDGNGNLLQERVHYWTGKWEPGYQTTSTYNSNNRVKTRTYYNHDGQKWVADYMDSTGYNANGVMNYNLSKEWDPNLNIWINSSLETRLINANGLATEASFSEWNDNNNKWQKEFDATITYNANNLPEKLIGYMYLNGTKVPLSAFERNYYYEQYYNVGVADIDNAMAVKVYPNPATTQLNLLLPHNNAKVTLATITGQVVYDRLLPGNNDVISTTGLPAGNYILNILAVDGRTHRQLVTVQ